MAPQDAVNTPTIKFCTDLKPGTPLWETTKTQVFNAMKDFGYFEAIYEEIPNDTVKTLFEHVAESFQSAAKLNEYSKKPYPRYEGQIPHYPVTENIMHTADMQLPESIETLANTLWPNGNPDFCNAVTSYYKPLIKLDEMVKMMVLEGLGLQSYMDEFLNSSNIHYLRCTKYFKATEGEDGMMGHTDASFLSILKQNQPGLQVLSNNGEWIELEVKPNSYFVLSSDSLNAWTNDRIPAALHRVIMTGDNRTSTLLFSLPKPGYIVKAPKELVDEEHPLHFKPFDIADYYDDITKKGEFRVLQAHVRVV